MLFAWTERQSKFSWRVRVRLDVERAPEYRHRRHAGEGVAHGHGHGRHRVQAATTDRGYGQPNLNLKNWLGDEVIRGLAGMNQKTAQRDATGHKE